LVFFSTLRLDKTSFGAQLLPCSFGWNMQLTACFCF